MNKISTPLAVLLLALAATAPPPAAAQNVVDGDTLTVKGTTYRLYGIAAPDEDQICADGWPAGFEAEAYLSRLIEGKTVVCTPVDQPGRSETDAICHADGVDVGGAMVTGGMALALVPNSARYITQEAAAAKAGRGVHRHGCVAPWEWRARLAPAK
jgi:endonuclease YncB( thermonuclease family)